MANKLLAYGSKSATCPVMKTEMVKRADHNTFLEVYGAPSNYSDIDSNKLERSSDDTHRYRALNSLQISQPSSCFLLGDTLNKGGGFVQTQAWNLCTADLGFHIRHGAVGNIAFMDGHAEAVRAEQGRDMYKETLWHSGAPYKRFFFFMGIDATGGSNLSW